MAVPKKKVSRKRGRTRRAQNFKIAMPGRIVECPQCHKMRLAHRACKSCGYYDGRQVMAAADEN